jgi:hypothetical protein
VKFFDLVLMACAIFFTGAAVAAGVSTPLKLTVYPALVVTFSPATAKVPCDTPAGTVIATVMTKGGNGNPITPVLSGTTNFVLQGANHLVVAPAGIATADCSGKSEMVHVTAMQ